MHQASCLQLSTNLVRQRSILFSTRSICFCSRNQTFWITNDENWFSKWCRLANAPTASTVSDIIKIFQSALKKAMFRNSIEMPTFFVVQIFDSIIIILNKKGIIQLEISQAKYCHICGTVDSFWITWWKTWIYHISNSQRFWTI